MRTQRAYLGPFDLTPFPKRTSYFVETEIKKLKRKTFVNVIVGRPAGRLLPFFVSFFGASERNSAQRAEIGI